MELKCILNILKEQNHINFYAYGFDSMPMFYKIESKRGHKLGEKILEVFKTKEKDNYIFTQLTHPCTEIEFVKKEEVLNWLKQNKFQKTERRSMPWKKSHLDFKLTKFIKEKTEFEIEIGKFDNATIINNKLIKENNKKQKKEEQKAIELVNLLLK